MLTIEGTYKDGKIELPEKPAQLSQSRVLVTFLDARKRSRRPAVGLGHNDGQFGNGAGF
jgi:hypothetical protein